MFNDNEPTPDSSVGVLLRFYFSEGRLGRESVSRSVSRNRRWLVRGRASEKNNCPEDHSPTEEQPNKGRDFVVHGTTGVTTLGITEGMVDPAAGMVLAAAAAAASLAAAISASLIVSADLDALIAAALRLAATFEVDAAA